jgi:subtilisin-like proprotein convertase family protein
MGTPKKVATVLFAGALALTMGALTAPDTAHAAAETVTASNATPIAPPDGNLAGATSTVAVSGHTGHITDLNVTLKSVTSTFPGDLDVALTGPNGKSVMLISDICGTTDWTARDITIDDEAGQDFANAANCAAGTTTWPIDVTQPDTGFLPVPTNGPLHAFDGASPNGNWVLTVADDTAVDTATIDGGFTLTIALSDEVAPVTTITQKPKTSTKPKASISFTSNEAGATFECNLDGLGWNPCTSPKKLKKLSVGKHTFQVRATDAAKNVGVPAKVSWKVKPKH